MWLVTLKLPKRADHDATCKVTGRCPAPGGGICTDVTGQHHSVLVRADSADDAAARFPDHHITRVEEAIVSA